MLEAIQVTSGVEGRDCLADTRQAGTDWFHAHGVQGVPFFLSSTSVQACEYVWDWQMYKLVLRMSDQQVLLCMYVSFIN